jgi:hypothetical protein
VPEIQLGVGIIVQVEDEFTGLLSGSGGLGVLGRMGGFRGSVQKGVNIPLLPNLPKF